MATVRGRVVDSQGRGVAATVYASRKGPGGRGRNSDSAGRFVLSGVAVGPTDLSVRREGGVMRVVDTVEVLPGDNEVELFLDGALIRGRVVDQEGHGVGSALVLTGGGFATRSSPDGRFEILDVEPGLNTLRVTHDRLVAVEPAEIEVLPGEEVEAEIVMVPGGGIRGRVLGVAAGALAGVSVQAHGPDHRPRVEVDTEGRFQIAGVGPGMWTLVGRLGSHGREIRRQVLVKASLQEVEQDLDFSEPGWAVRGRVVLDERPLPNVRLRLSLREEGATERRVSSDWRGDFLFDGLPEGSYRLEIPGLMFRSSSPLWTENLEVDLDLDLGDLVLE